MTPSDPSDRRPPRPLAPKPPALRPTAPPPDATEERTQLITGKGAPFSKLVAEAKLPAPPPPPPPAAFGSKPAAGKAWKPYRWTLPKVSKAQALLVQKLEWLLPEVTSAGRVKDGVLGRLQELLEEPVGLAIDAVSVISPRDGKKFLSQPAALGVLAPLPQKSRGLIEVELGLAHALIDKLLGGTGEQLALRPLTEIEEGVMSYLLLEVLKALAPFVEPGLPRLKLEAMIKSPDEAQRLLEAEPLVVVCQLRGMLGAASGHVRLYVPASVLGMVAPPAEGKARRARRRAELSANLSRLQRVRASLRAEIGHAEISSRELAHLRLKDVVLVDGLSVRPDRDGAGKATLVLGSGASGTVEADVAIAGGKCKLTVRAFREGKPTPVAPPPEEHEAPAEAESPAEEPNEDASSDELRTDTGVQVIERTDVGEIGEGAELLNDIPLQISVELGRVGVTAEEVVSLKVGQVIELSRVPGEPVDLSVNGKIVARGEVVEVEGHLGVRITSLAG